MATHWTLGCDAHDPHALASFWSLALGYVVEPGYEDPDGASLIDPEGIGPAVGFLRVAESKTSKNRMHIDVRVAGDQPWDWVKRADLIRATVQTLQEAGGQWVRDEIYTDDQDQSILGHVVMLDPEGNEFCVA